jgi:hypothetical protein
MTWSRDAAGGAKRRSGRETSRQHVRGRKRPATFKIEWPPVEDARPGSRHPALANSGGMPAGARAALSGAWAARTGVVSAVATRDGVVALDARMGARRNFESRLDNVEDEVNCVALQVVADLATAPAGATRTSCLPRQG